MTTESYHVIVFIRTETFWSTALARFGDRFRFVWKLD